MTLQEIFNTAIESGLYMSKAQYRETSPNLTHVERGVASWYMCDVINECGLISEKDCLKAKKSIENYLGEFDDLKSLLMHNNKPHSFADRLAIFKDWAKRPKLNYRGILESEEITK